MNELHTNDHDHETTHRLIASGKVDGTAVYDAEGERLGSIDNLMIDKQSGKVEYAVLRFGGILGLGSDFYPLPWQLLSYDSESGGYVVDIDKSMFEKAPRYAEEEPHYDRGYEDRLQGYYGITMPV